ncbi:MAG: phosphoenolpyruvate kinase [Elusimicrobia bacterium]|nr:phosphoenolpyruvate kinase [Elusimicrobiota bacterium]
MSASLTPASIKTLRAKLRTANLAFQKAYPGDSHARQPVHTVYGGAHLFKSDTARKLGEAALAAMTEYAPDAGAMAQGFGLPGGSFAAKVHERVLEKLRREAVEDFRIDYEDGYGNRPDAEEDGHAESVAREAAKGLAAGTLPPFIGLRIKPFSEELFERSARTLDLFVTTLVRTARRLPPNFVVTLPKVTHAEQVTALVGLLERLEKKLALPAGALALELMVETPQSILAPDGACHLPRLVAAARGRCAGAHFGTYDYTALCNITAAHQHMAHPACDFAKHMMQVSLAQTGVQLSDGATNVMPVGPHRATADRSLTPEQARQNRETVWRAWRLAYGHIRHSLETGFYQGWDLHPAQLPVRYAAVYAFFLEGAEPASARLRAFMGKAAQATLLGDVFDDAATGQGLLNYFLRGLSCGAITSEEAAATGLTVAEFQTRSFLRILAGRRTAKPGA